jgi:endonuclease YncB( thermonuclease family)
MAYGASRRYPEMGRIKRSNIRALIVIIILAGAAGYVAYTQWTTKNGYPSWTRQWTRHWTRHWTPQAPITGRPFVIDGDTVDIAGTRVRLEGIDAPELEQSCTDAKGQSWACGRVAARELKSHIGNRDVTCTPTAVDRYRRVLAVCSLSGSDVNAWMVRQGWAMAYGYGGGYHAQQDEARAARRGIWAGSFVPPGEWRKQHH